MQMKKQWRKVEGALATTALYRKDIFGNAVEPVRNGVLSERFSVPPFSVLNAREGWWQDRKRAWIALGIKSEIGRGGVDGPGRCYGQDLMKGENENFSSGTEKTAAYKNQGAQRALMASKGRSGANPCDLGGGLAAKLANRGSIHKASPGGSARPACDYTDGHRRDGHGRRIIANTSSSSSAMAIAGGFEGSSTGESGTSIFDPTLTELCYRWFCPPKGQVIDPFAGGSVRGIVASVLGYRYWGCDLREEQIRANQVQAKKICPDAMPSWVSGDSMSELPNAPKADFVFSCPPYGDLEKYSDDPQDLSSMDYPIFISAYKRIILRACNRLKPNRFACFVVGDFRDKKGYCRNFPADTIAAFREQGLELYNEAILLTAIGSLPVRVTKGFEVSRKLGKTHQNVLVFVKGDARKAASAINVSA